MVKMEQCTQAEAILQRCIEGKKEVTNWRLALQVVSACREQSGDQGCKDTYRELIEQFMRLPFVKPRKDPGPAPDIEGLDTLLKSSQTAQAATQAAPALAQAGANAIEAVRLDTEGNKVRAATLYREVAEMLRNIDAAKYSLKINEYTERANELVPLIAGATVVEPSVVGARRAIGGGRTRRKSRTRTKRKTRRKRKRTKRVKRSRRKTKRRSHKRSRKTKRVRSRMRRTYRR